METIIFASSNSLYKDSYEGIKASNSNYNWIYIEDNELLNFNNLSNLNPTKIFLPHWSFIIPSDVFLNFECIVFHMTDLPYGRGGSPLQNLIIRGHKSTVISALKVAGGIDTGDIYLKRPLSLEGNATSIFTRAAVIIEKMIFTIIDQELVPIPQNGEITTFSRRKPSDSNIEKISDLNTIFDYIRMLDAPGYPKAFIETAKIRFEFQDARIEKDKKIIANVRITKK